MTLKELQWLTRGTIILLIAWIGTFVLMFLGEMILGTFYFDSGLNSFLGIIHRWSFYSLIPATITLIVLRLLNRDLVKQRNENGIENIDQTLNRTLHILLVPGIVIFILLLFITFLMTQGGPN